MIKCPYCSSITYSYKHADISKRNQPYKDWFAVSKHISNCKNNTHTYFIDNNVGPIHYTYFISKRYTDILKDHPTFTSRMVAVRKYFYKYGIDIGSSKLIYSKDSIIAKIQEYVKITNKLPNSKQDNTEVIKDFPSAPTVRKYFGSWNAAIEAAGFVPNAQNGYGINTYGLDGHLYRSQAEAYFADTYLYGKYSYNIEPKYPEPHNRYYDWYIPSLDLYIELDGGIRPDTIKEKISINKCLQRDVLFIDFCMSRESIEKEIKNRKTE